MSKTVSDILKIIEENDIKSLVYAMGHTTAQMSLDRYADNSSEHTSKEMQQKFSSGLTTVS